MIVAFADDEEEEGKAVKKLLKALARDNAEAAGELEIILIDPDEFPLMVDAWEDMFDVEIEDDDHPVIGLIDIEDVSFLPLPSSLLSALIRLMGGLQQEGIWFDMSQLNLDEPNRHRDTNLEVLQTWVDQILNGSISLDDGSPLPLFQPLPASHGSLAAAYPTPHPPCPLA